MGENRQTCRAEEIQIIYVDALPQGGEHESPLLLCGLL